MNEKMERLLTILQDVNDEIDFAHERHMVCLLYTSPSPRDA